MNKTMPLLLVLVSMVVIISGCTSLSIDAETLALDNPVVGQFLEDYPDAKVTVIHYTESESENIIEQVRSDCEKDWLEPKELYKVTVEDEGAGLYAMAWIDAGAMGIECAVKMGIDVEDVDNDQNTTEEEKICIDMCGNGVCDDFVCKGENCSCPETYGTCPGDCAPSQGNWTEQYMCKGNWRYRYYQHGEGSNQGFSWKNYEYCPYGCDGGECKPAPPVNQSQNRWLNQYQCQHHWRQRLYQYANGTQQWFNHSYCQSGCSNGECVQNQTTNQSKWQWTKQYRCNESWRQRKQVHTNGSYQWQNYQHCAYGCDGNECNPYQNQSGRCANEGELFSVVYDQYPDTCCGNLTEWDSGMDTSISVGTECYKTGLVAGSPVGTCINCGNGICEDIENVCNCPGDCPAGENADYINATVFCNSPMYTSLCITNTVANLAVCDLCNLSGNNAAASLEPVPVKPGRRRTVVF